jgi:SAM-dependent methyltransferase
MTDNYRDDLAHIHDAGYGELARNAAEVLLKALRPRRRGLVLDLGCGSGILSEQVAAAGYDVLGIDQSPAMLELARRRVPGAEFRLASLWTAELPPCVGVAAVGEVLNYLFVDDNTKRLLVTLLRRIWQALTPGGVLLLDVAEPGRVPGPGPRQLGNEGDGWAVVVHAEEDRRRRLLTRRITSFRKVGELYRRDHEVHRQRLIPRTEMVRRLRTAGFHVRTLRGYGPKRFPVGLVGFLARKDR